MRPAVKAITDKGADDLGERGSSRSMSDLPEGWCRTTVKQVSKDISYGFTTSASRVPTGPKLLRITDIQDGAVDWDSVPFCKVPPIEPKRFLLKTGDIVFARTGATTGKSFLIPSTPGAVFASYLIRLRAAQCILPEFLAYFFRSSSYWKQITENLSGSAQPNCNASKLASLDIAIPPLNEQQRIVGKLEKLLSHVGAAEARLAIIPLILRRFRQSVLAAACSGRLTADWREQNAHGPSAQAIVGSLFERRLSEAETVAKETKLRVIYDYNEENDSQNLPEGWSYVALDKLCDSFNYGTSAKSHLSGLVPVLRMGNIQNGEIDWTDLVYTSNKDEVASYILEPQTVVFNRTNSPELVGKTAIYRGERPAIFAGYLIRVNNFEMLDSAYLNYCLNTNYARKFCSNAKTDGVSQSNINAQKLGKFEVPFCSLAEQQEIVRRIEALFKTADALEARYRTAKAYVDKLRQSILAKAFRGELVPQDPNDEPASVLLARISQAGAQSERKPKRPRNQAAPAASLK